MRAGLTRREQVEIVVAAALVAIAGVLDYAGLNAVLRFVAAAVALAVLARLVGTATEQLGGRLGAGGAGSVQSALGNLPELFVALFALQKGLIGVVKAALIGSVLANSLAHEQTLSLICGGVLLVVFVSTLGIFLTGDAMAQEPPRWSLTATIAVLAAAAAGAVFVSDWFVSALEPATASLHMSQTFAGLVVVAIAGNAVENVVGVQLALRNRPDFAISVIVNSSLQVALALTPVILFASLFFATSMTLVFPTLLAISLLLAAFVTAVVVYDGESTWPEGVVLIGLYVVIASAFWWG
ncbi:MAG: hypothetical protein AUG88_05080 [Actinobacteria bacterium 13_1_20CM_4_68_12]|nr:MAG: hypothetical protein AUG88_05080 [Actinobacteria bacterium 13_1_20CM_4_68_12]